MLAVKLTACGAEGPLALLPAKVRLKGVAWNVICTGGGEPGLGGGAVAAEITSRTRSWPVSAMKRLPDGFNATASGLSIPALSAVPPSPRTFGDPAPATV